MEEKFYENRIYHFFIALGLIALYFAPIESFNKPFLKSLFPFTGVLMLCWVIFYPKKEICFLDEGINFTKGKKTKYISWNTIEKFEKIFLFKNQYFNLAYLVLSSGEYVFLPLFITKKKTNPFIWCPSYVIEKIEKCSGKKLEHSKIIKK